MRKRSLPVSRRELLAAALLTSGLGLVGTAAPAAARPRALSRFTLPAPTGPACLGTVALHLVDPTRTDPWVPAHPARELMVQIWYPARDTRAYPAAPWLSAGAVPHFADSFGLPADLVRATTTHARTGAPVDRRTGGHPVLLYSPGLGGDRGTSTALAEDLAGHGYVVVTIDHTHDASEVEFPDGRVEVAAIPEIDDQVIAQVAAVRAADTRFVLDQLAAINAGTHRLTGGLRGAVDLSRVGMFGHSLGGSTTAAVMHDDPRVRAGVNLDGTLVGAAAVAGSERPFLLLSSDHGPGAEDPSWDTFWANQRGWKRELSLSGAAHGSFNDGVVFYPQAAPIIGLTPEQLAELVGTLEPQRSVAIQRAYLRAFFDQHLRGGDGRLLRAADPRYPEMRFVR
ncbi:alpha/beta hydrolase family protein [Actinoplanes awajinensis]|uniref:Hydrolase n=1 Tax=Actinoplanes awajinensis subsp. mycoplanecinus TaxID=135947 RepID=A0A101JKJ3_9ACTN|nr:hydrolase [Actinoplanes awajinensis]KUL28056.1 hydrolase [Actinoplanes awajinensis subsp. mycoplanecinus]